MIKKITALLLILSLSACVSACSVNDNPKEDKQTKATTEQVTLIRNTFKDVLPKYNFKNEIKETYVDGINYKFTVKCTQKDSEKYIDKIKKAGFELNAAEGTNYYSARTEDYYSVEITYIGETLTVLCKRV